MTQRRLNPRTSEEDRAVLDKRHAEGARRLA